ncbi:MAG TPA: tRNA glutamyl-Q(34) synthetase GluQRS [Rhodocyclaceae bacterium]
MSIGSEPSLGPKRYRGRFAPSPTGPLHLGSLVAAVGSWLDARAAGGEWLLRIEDVDVGRCQPGAEDSILRTLEACGLTWDGPVVRQSERTEAYAAALDALRAAGEVYLCACSRKAIEALTDRRAADGALIYPGTCRGGLATGVEARAWRLRVPAAAVEFDDRLLGRCSQRLAEEVGDCVLWRADGLAAYQLAVVVDDAEQAITDVVRGADLFDATPRQIHLQRCLHVPTPRYAHLPVMANEAGEKLSKQTLAPAIEAAAAGVAITAALEFLGHRTPVYLRGAPPADQLAWARGAWSLVRVPARNTIAVNAAIYSSPGRR